MENKIDNDYLAKRQLKRGTAGWLLLAGLGISYVISGDFAGWNFGKEAKPFRFHARLNFGYFHAEQVSDIFEDVPNTAFLFSPEIGFKYTFKQLPITLNLGSGYYLFTGEGGESPGTLQPLYYHLDITYQIFKN